MNKPHDPIVLKLIKVMGGREQVQKAFNITSFALYKWLWGGIPAKRWLAVQEKTGGKITVAQIVKTRGLNERN